MKRESKMYCKLCKGILKNRDGSVFCKCKNRSADNLKEFGIPVDWQGKSEINKMCNLKNTRVDFVIGI